MYVYLQLLVFMTCADGKGGVIINALHHTLISIYFILTNTS